MLQDLRKLIGSKLEASDGEIGHVKDFYFDDRTWMVRYLVADTGGWLTGRQVLLTPDAFGLRAFGKSTQDPKSLRVTLSRQRIEDSPSIDEHQPVSRQHEVEYYQHYGWPMYWNADPMSGAGAMAPVAIAPMLVSEPVDERMASKGDAHLRSMLEVKGYSLSASDGEIGKVTGLVVDDRTWRILEMAVETGHWYAGKEILVLPESISHISYEESTVYVELSREQIRATPSDDVVRGYD
ncbi:MAG: PRC-barrel domain-containing protein [Burkholderiales bacterium]|nr:PRC-barrel domain-containing protein [Opitutaceae bacterium]